VSRRRVGVLLAVLLGAPALVAVAGAAEPSPGKAHQGKGKPAAPKHKSPGPQVLAKSWALIDGRTGEVLTSHAGDERRLIASTP